MKIAMAAILAILIAAAVAFLRLSEKTFRLAFVKRALEVRAEAGTQPPDVIAESDLKGLPEPVARYLRFTRVVGKKRISGLRLTHSGSFRTSARSPFRPIRGEYYITTKKPSFCWLGTLRLAPGISAAAFDSYFAGRGRMLVKLMSVFTIVDAMGEKTDNSAFGRCIAEMSMAPTFFLDRDLIRWEATGRDSAKCVVTDAGFTTEAELHVNPDGSLDRTVVMRYFDRGKGRGSLERFTGKASGFKEQAGFVLPARYDGFWNLPEGDLHYVSFKVESIDIE
jgi:hypothetical protein